MSGSANTILHALHFGHDTTRTSTTDTPSISAASGTGSSDNNGRVDDCASKSQLHSPGAHLGTVCSVEDFNDDDNDYVDDTTANMKLKSNSMSGEGTLEKANHQSSTLREGSNAAADAAMPQTSSSSSFNRSMSIGSEIQLTMLGSFDGTGFRDAGLAALSEGDESTNVRYTEANGAVPTN